MFLANSWDFDNSKEINMYNESLTCVTVSKVGHCLQIIILNASQRMGELVRKDAAVNPLRFTLERGPAWQFRFLFLFCRSNVERAARLAAI